MNDGASRSTDDIEAIKQLKARYFRCVDTKDWAGLADVFTPEVTVEIAGHGGPVTSTADAFAARVRRALDGATSVHHGHMPEIRLTSETSASGVWAMEDRIWWPDGAPIRSLHGYGHYHETYEATAHGWRIATMRLTRLRIETDPPTPVDLRRAATVEFVAVDAASPPARWAVGEYFAEIDRRFPGGFDPGDGIDHEIAALSPPGGRFLLAMDHDDPVGCGGVLRHDDDTAEIKRMWIRTDWRGVGLGRRQLDALEAAAVDLGYRRVVLDTNSTLTEAMAMYERAGYDAIARYNDNPYAERWFGKDLRPPATRTPQPPRT